MEITAFQKLFAQAHGSVVNVGQESIFDDHATASTGLEDFDEMLKKKGGGLASANGKILLHFRPFTAAKRRIGQHHLIAVFFLNVGKVFGQRVRVDDVQEKDRYEVVLANPPF